MRSSSETIEIDNCTMHLHIKADNMVKINFERNAVTIYREDFTIFHSHIDILLLYL